MFVLVASVLPLIVALPTNYWATVNLTYDQTNHLNNLNTIDAIPGIDPNMAASLKSAIGDVWPDYVAWKNGTTTNYTTTMSPELAAWFDQPNMTNFLVNINPNQPSTGGIPAAAPALSSSLGYTTTVAPPVLIGGSTLLPGMTTTIGFPGVPTNLPVGTTLNGQTTLLPGQTTTMSPPGSGSSTTLSSLPGAFTTTMSLPVGGSSFFPSGTTTVSPLTSTFGGSTTMSGQTTTMAGTSQMTTMVPSQYPGGTTTVSTSTVPGQTTMVPTVTTLASAVTTLVPIPTFSSGSSTLLPIGTTIVPPVTTTVMGK